METHFYIDIDNGDIDIINEVKDICSRLDCKFRITEGDDKKVLHCLKCNDSYDMENYRRFK